MNLVVDILLVSILLLYFFRGWDNGLMYAVVNIIGVVGSYLLATLVAPFLTPVISEKYDLALVIGYILSWAVIFLVIVFVFWILKRTALKNITYHIRSEEDFHLPLYSKIIGGVVSLSLGTVVVAISIFFYGLMSGGIRDSKLPDISGSRVVDASSFYSKRIAYTGLVKATGNKSFARRFAKILGKPHRSMKNIRRVIGSPIFRSLVSDSRFINAVIEQREVDIANNEALIVVLLDDKLMKSIYELGLVKKADYKSVPFRNWLSHKFVTLEFDKVVVKQRMATLRQEGLLSKQNFEKLLKDKRFHEVIDQLFFKEKIVPVS